MSGNTPISEITIKRLGEKLRQIRLSAGLTLDEMAAMLGRKEKSRRARVLEWETEKREPDLVTVLRYAIFAEVSVDCILRDEQDLPEIQPESYDCTATSIDSDIHTENYKE